MIADLHARELSAHRWGAKASRLSQAARHGIAVPPGLCLDTAQASAPPTHQHEVITAWLTARRPATIIVRSSSTDEDTQDTSAAGRYLTLRDIAPEPGAVLAAAHQVHQVHQALAPPGQPPAGSVIVQQQLPAELMGVTFTHDDGFLTEGSPLAAAVTDGEPPTFRMNCRNDGYTLHGTLQTVPPALLAHDLQRLIARLHEVFDFPLDIEWATVAGHPFLLQVRPVTAPTEEPA